MYRDTPADLVPKAKATKARGVRAQPPPPGMWELLGSSVEELKELGQKLQRSKKKPDRLLASKVCAASQSSCRGLPAQVEDPLSLSFVERLRLIKTMYPP